MRLRCTQLNDSLPTEPQEFKARLIVDLLVDELKAHLCVERSAQQILLEYLDVEFSAQGPRPVYERMPDPGSLEFRINE